MTKHLALLFSLALIGCKSPSTLRSFASLPSAQTIYVSASLGADGNPGTQKVPLKTIARATALMQPGDTLLLNSGEKWDECVTATGDGQTFGAYGVGAKPIFGSGCVHGFVGKSYNNLTVRGVAVMGTTAEGMEFSGINGTLDTVVVDQVGSSGVFIHPTYTSGPSLTGWTLTNVYVGTINRPKGLNYNVAGIETRGMVGLIENNVQVATRTQMGIQDRAWGSVACGKNTLTKSRVTDNEGEITWVCPDSTVSYTHAWNGRGFGLQQGVRGNAWSVQINDIGLSSDGRLYNGVDDNGAKDATMSNMTISNVSGCSITAEGTGTGIHVNGGSIDATKGGQCALYTTASAGRITFDGKTTWTTLPPPARPFKVGGLSWANMMTQAMFTAATK